MTSIKKSFTLFVLLVLLFITPASTLASETTLADNVYSHEKLGWEMTIPQGWQVSKTEDIKKLIDAGKKDMEDAHEGNVKVLPYEILLIFKKDTLNQFVSTVQDFDLEKEGALKNFTKTNEDMISRTFTHKGITFDKKSYQKQIGSVNFEVFEFILYQTPKKESVILYQSYFFGEASNRMMSVNINANTRENYNALINAFHNSKLNPSP